MFVNWRTRLSEQGRGKRPRLLVSQDESLEAFKARSKHPTAACGVSLAFLQLLKGSIEVNSCLIFNWHVAVELLHYVSSIRKSARRNKHPSNLATARGRSSSWKMAEPALLRLLLPG